jgi:hypothetical protein
MTNRERTLTSGFFIGLGGLVLLTNLFSILAASSPPPTTSPLRAGLSELLVTVFGVPLGYIAFHTLFALIGAALIWLGLKVRRQGIDG